MTPDAGTPDAVTPSGGTPAGGTADAAATPAAREHPAEGQPATSRPGRLVRIVRQVPFTTGLVLLLLVVGLVSRSVLSSALHANWFPEYAYGLPSFRRGAWWTAVAGALPVARPLLYPLVLVFVAIAVGWLEWYRGTRMAAAYFVVGQLGTVALTALLVSVLSRLGAGWALDLATHAAVGPVPGGLVCLTAGVCLLVPSPWRGRIQLLLTVVVLISVLFLGSLTDLQHAVAIGGTLLVNGRTVSLHTARERRFVAWTFAVALVVVHLITSVVSTEGPFGTSDPDSSSAVSVAVNLAVGLGVANGLRHGRRLAWLASVVWASLNVLAGAVAVVVLVWLPQDAGSVASSLPQAAAISVLWLLFLVYLVRARSAFGAGLRRRLPGSASARHHDVRAIVQQTGGGVLSWMATWRDNSYFLETDPDSLVAYQTHAGVALALGDPIAPEQVRRQRLADFADAAVRAGLLPCVFGAGEATRAMMPAGWRSLQVAEDTIVDLPGLSFTGKRWGNVRTAMNRAAREQVTFRMTTLAQEPAWVVRQVDAISDQWVGDQGLPEMRFTLGTVEEALDPAVRLVLAETAQGVVEGFLSWLPVYAPGGVVQGWTLDLMRRREGGFPPVMEFLIASSALAFRDEGATFLSLSGAPLAHRPQAPERVIESLLDRLGEALEPVYGFRSLHRFKQKFNPRAEPIYLLYPQEDNLPRIGVALARAYLPDASVTDLLRAGVDAVRPSETAAR